MYDQIIGSDDLSPWLFLLINFTCFVINQAL